MPSTFTGDMPEQRDAHHAFRSLPPKTAFPCSSPHESCSFNNSLAGLSLAASSGSATNNSSEAPPSPSESSPNIRFGSSSDSEAQQNDKLPSFKRTPTIRIGDKTHAQSDAESRERERHLPYYLILSRMVEDRSESPVAIVDSRHIFRRCKTDHGMIYKCSTAWINSRQVRVKCLPCDCKDDHNNLKAQEKESTTESDQEQHTPPIDILACMHLHKFLNNFSTFALKPGYTSLRSFPHHAQNGVVSRLASGLQGSIKQLQLKFSSHLVENTMVVHTWLASDIGVVRSSSRDPGLLPKISLFTVLLKFTGLASQDGYALQGRIKLRRLETTTFKRRTRKPIEARLTKELTAMHKGIFDARGDGYNAGRDANKDAQLWNRIEDLRNMLWATTSEVHSEYLARAGKSGEENLAKE